MSKPITVNNNLNSIDSIKINFASPEQIRRWSYGEVKNAKTYNNKNIAEEDGLFCEKIFGPIKDYECKCGKYKTIKHKGHICEDCGVEVTNSSVRRERMGHIELAAPIINRLLIPTQKDYLAEIIGLKHIALSDVIYYNKYIVTDPKETTLKYKELLTYEEYIEHSLDDDFGEFDALIGAEAVRALLKNINIDTEIEKLKDDLNYVFAKEDRKRMIRRLKLLEGFRDSGNKLEWLVMDVIPVLPPDLRNMIMLDNGKNANSDLNEFYSRIIQRNNRLKSLIKQGSPEIILNDQKRSLQNNFDALIENEKCKTPIQKGSTKTPYKSLTKALAGKEGLFRQNILGKRVDYSGRSVIVVGPDLKMNQCGLPRDMALEIFKPFVMHKLYNDGYVRSVKEAKNLIESKHNSVWDVLSEVIKDKTIMLNRAPTLHKLSIQAFEPVLVSGKAIRLHPLVCTAYNADFDGDQMAVHLSLSKEAQEECRNIMFSTKNLLKPADGEIIAIPSQDMILGVYYLTIDQYKAIEDLDKSIKPKRIYRKQDENANIKAVMDDLRSNKINKDDIIKIKINGKASKSGDIIAYKDILCKAIDVIGRKYKTENDAYFAYENKEITLNQPIYIERVSTLDGEEIKEYVKTTLGRIIFNSIIPQDLGFVDRTSKDTINEYEINFLVGKKEAKKILNKCIEVHGMDRTAKLLDDFKSLGYKYSTISGITVSIDDMTVPEEKPELIRKAQNIVDKINSLYNKGHLTDEERYNEVIKVWDIIDKEMTAKLLDGFDRYNNIYVMADSGARGSEQQIKQLAGMRGLMADTMGKTIELPIKSNFREGLNILEYFISAHGARKGMADTALRTADAGYLTRKLIESSQQIIVRADDCMEEEGLDTVPGHYISTIIKGNETVEELKERLYGRYSAETIYDENENIIVEPNTYITKKIAGDIINKGVDSKGIKFLNEVTGKENPEAKIKIRTVLSCKLGNGVCAKCYGLNNATGKLAKKGETVGVMAAQSIGEPGTQLTMRTFHTGGVAGGGDITQGLPRVEELLEARKPKGVAVLSELSGRIEIGKKGNLDEVAVIDDEKKLIKKYAISYGSTLAVHVDDYIEAGEPLTVGSYNLDDLLKIKGADAVKDYIISEIQRVYRLQGVDISDKHVEVIVSQMFKMCKIKSSGDSDKYKDEDIIEIRKFEYENKLLKELGLNEMTMEPIITKTSEVSLNSDGFLSAISFERTSSGLTEAAIYGKTDSLMGVKENIILGRNIPAGTGYVED